MSYGEIILLGLADLSAVVVTALLFAAFRK
jgi:hypothetical protein